MLPTNSVTDSVRQVVDGHAAQQRRSALGGGSLSAVGTLLVLVGAWLTWVIADSHGPWWIGVAMVGLGVPLLVVGAVFYHRSRRRQQELVARITADQAKPVG